MPTQIEMTSELEQAVRAIDNARTAFYSVDLREVVLSEALAPVLSEIDALRALLPEIAKRADFYQHADEYFDGDDYEAELEGVALLAMYVMMDGFSLGTQSPGQTRYKFTFSSCESALNSFGEDLSNLQGYCPAWDWEHGVWTDDGRDHRG